MFIEEPQEVAGDLLFVNAITFSKRRSRKMNRAVPTCLLGTQALPILASHLRGLREHGYA